MDKVLYVENGTHVQADLCAVFVGNPTRFVNENPNNGFIVRSRDFRVHQFESVVNCCLFCYYLQSFKDRTCAHVTLRKALPPKRKSGREPTGRDRRASSKP